MAGIRRGAVPVAGGRPVAMAGMTRTVARRVVRVPRAGRAVSAAPLVRDGRPVLARAAAPSVGRSRAAVGHGGGRRSEGNGVPHGTGPLPIGAGGFPFVGGWDGDPDPGKQVRDEVLGGRRQDLGGGQTGRGEERRERHENEHLPAGRPRSRDDLRKDLCREPVEPLGCEADVPLQPLKLVRGRRRAERQDQSRDTGVPGRSVVGVHRACEQPVGGASVERREGSHHPSIVRAGHGVTAGGGTLMARRRSPRCCRTRTWPGRLRTIAATSWTLRSPSTRSRTTSA